MASKLSGIELTRYDDLFKTDAEREADRQERIQIVPAAEVFPYSRQPYTIDRPTPDLVRLMDSIEHIGIAEPLIVRPRESGGYQEVTIFDRPALFTECRVDRATVPEGVYRYELRHGDEDWGEPIELSRSLMVNFYGTVLTRDPFQLPLDGWIPLESGSLSFQDGGCRTLAEFQEKYPASDKDVIDFYSVNEPALHALYFSRSEEQDKSAGCVGHLRGDFGSGKQFYTTWWPHQADRLNTPEFKADIDRTVNWLREQPGSPLRDFDSMKRYCNRYEQICAIKGALLPSCGFMVKTKQYVYTRTSCDTVVYTAVFSSVGNEAATDSSSFNWLWLLIPVGAAALGGCGYAGYKGYHHYINKKRGYAA